MRTKVGKETPMHPMLKRSLDLTLNLSSLPVNFLDHLIDGFTREIDSFKKKMAQKMVKPQTGKQVESFLGFLNFLRNFVLNYATIVALLDKLRKMRHLGKAWGEEQDKSFDFFKEVILNALVLSQPDWD